MAPVPGLARKRILDAAEQLLAEEGWEGFSLRKLCSKIGLTAAAVYVHFKDKQALVTELLDREFSTAAGAWFRSHPQPMSPTPRERLFALSGFYLHMGLTNIVNYRVRFFHGPSTDKQIREWAAGKFAEGDNALALFRGVEAWREAEIPESTLSAGEVYIEIWGILHGQILALSALDSPVEDRVEQALAVLEKYMAGSREKLATADQTH